MIRRVKPAYLFVRKEGGGRLSALAWVDVDALESRCWMDAHDRVDGLDWLTANGLPGSSGAICLGYRAVEGCQTLEVLLEAWAQR